MAKLKACIHSINAPIVCHAGCEADGIETVSSEACCLQRQTRILQCGNRERYAEWSVMGSQVSLCDHRAQSSRTYKDCHMRQGGEGRLGGGAGWMKTQD
jgi:hypothetical protein